MPIALEELQRLSPACSEGTLALHLDFRGMIVYFKRIGGRAADKLDPSQPNFIIAIAGLTLIGANPKVSGWFYFSAGQQLVLATSQTCIVGMVMAPPPTPNIIPYIKENEVILFSQWTALCCEL